MSDLILESWQANAEAWIKTIDNGDLESRILVTNQAIVDAVVAHGLGRVWDLGCGEGWLARNLAARGFQVVGTDAVSALIDRASALAGGPEYHCYSYEQLAKGEYPFAKQKFDAAVFNFALLDKENTEAILKSIHQYLSARATFFIQTLHPFVINAGHAYESGWRPGSWAGMRQTFVQPYDHYFRTVGDWISLLNSAGFSLEKLYEPLHPTTGQPASLLLVGRLR